MAAGTFYSQSPVVMGLPVSSVTATLGTNDGSLGQRVWRAGAEYVMIYNDCNSTILIGNAVVPQSSCSSPYSCTLSTTTSVDIALGCAHVSIPTGNYGWVVCKGNVTVEMEADNSAAAGNLLAIAANGEWCNKTISTGFVGPALGRANVALASGASGSAFISCF